MPAAEPASGGRPAPAARSAGPFGDVQFTGATHLNLTAGALLYLGGAFAYHRAKSLPSVLASTLFATGLVTGSLLIAQQNHVTGHMLCAGSAGTLASLMTVRAVTTRKPQVLGVGVAAGALTLYNYRKYLDWADHARA